MRLPDVFLVYLTFSAFALCESSRRKRRHLVYPTMGSKLQLIFGTGVPIPLDDISATIGWIIKYTMPVPNNASQYTDPLNYFSSENTGGSKRSIQIPQASRYELYRAFEKKLLSIHTAGKECLLRAICEVARVPLKGSSLMGKLWKLFLTPSSTADVPVQYGEHHYHKAEHIGRQSFSAEDCAVHYDSCDFDIIDLLTIIV